MLFTEGAEAGGFEAFGGGIEQFKRPIPGFCEHLALFGLGLGAVEACGGYA